MDATTYQLPKLKLLPLREQPIYRVSQNAARLGDAWLEAAFEERISGWGDDF